MSAKYMGPHPMTSKLSNGSNNLLFVVEHISLLRRSVGVIDVVGGLKEMFWESHSKPDLQDPSCNSASLSRASRAGSGLLASRAESWTRILHSAAVVEESATLPTTPDARPQLVSGLRNTSHRSHPHL